MRRLCMLCACLLMAAGCHSDADDDPRPYQVETVGQTKTFDVPGTYSTIQEAINAAGKGDFIRVAAGTYREDLTIAQKNFGMRGAGSGQTVLLGSVDIHDCSETSLEGFTVSGGGIHVKNSPARISGNEIIGSPIAGLWIEHASGVVLSDNTVVGNGKEGILFDDSQGMIGSNAVSDNGADGIVVSNSSPTMLRNLVVNNARDGISIRGFTSYAAPNLLLNTVLQNGGVSNYDIICFGSNTNPVGSGNAFDRCINCAECRTFGDPVTYQE